MSKNRFLQGKHHLVPAVQRCEPSWKWINISHCHGPCSVTFFQKNNHWTALTESLMMATLPLFSATLTTSHPHQTYIRPPSEFILYSNTTNKSSFLLLPLPTSTTRYLPQHNQSPTMLHTCSMLWANHIVHTPVIEVMGFGHHKDLWGFESALFGVTTSTDSGFTAVTGASQYLIMPKHMSKELAEPMNINWKTSSIHRFENG